MTEKKERGEKGKGENRRRKVEKKRKGKEDRRWRRERHGGEGRECSFATWSCL